MEAVPGESLSKTDLSRRNVILQSLLLMVASALMLIAIGVFMVFRPRPRPPFLLLLLIRLRNFLRLHCVSSCSHLLVLWARLCWRLFRTGCCNGLRWCP